MKYFLLTSKIWVYDALVENYGTKYVKFILKKQVERVFCSFMLRYT